MATFLLELGCEEIPARFVDGLVRDLAQSLIKQFLARQIVISEENVVCYATYRRLTVLIRDVPNMQADRTDVMVGPPLEIAKDNAGQWAPAAFGFSKKTGVSLEEMTVTQDAKGRDVLTAVLQYPGGKTQTCLPELIAEAVKAMHLPIAMRWAHQTHPFIRPVQWIVCLFDQDVVPVTLFGTTSGRVSRGHRFLSAASDQSIDGVSVTMMSPEDYVVALEAAYVQVDPARRKAFIMSHLTPHQQRHYGALIDEVVHLVEWPAPLVCGYDPAYLMLPDQVLIQTMVKHQKYFPMDDQGQLVPSFLVFAENARPENQATIAAGNSRVLTARLEDAKFFYEEDLKKPLQENLVKLERVVFQEGLGSLRDKVNRIGRFSLALNKLFGLSLTPQTLTDAASYIKSDLTTQMVYEFPDLQGVMGHIYALKQGVDPEVALAIEDHYKPQHSGAEVPVSVLGGVLGVADRMDTIVGSYLINQIPSGSKDPLGIRRAMYAVLSICHAYQWNFSLETLVSLAYDQYAKGQGNSEKLFPFFRQRMQAYIQELGNAHDTVEAVLSCAEQGFITGISYAYYLTQFRQNTPDIFKAFVETAVRVKRLSATLTDCVEIDPALFEMDIEKQAYAQAVPFLKGEKPLTELPELTEVMSAYFESVLVMADSPVVRQNRLGFLSHVSSVFARLAAFEKIVL